ncbi:adenosylcobinamide-GDP ribazoletransferase [Gloeobacter morelensis]|uniref:Adenosylcobinamide-GDP ribazoletransferase n=1 Tax=Gloeobacter morelensis MG652769 TaxID=2781736 RepID=A0ABY3PJ76_9CYAN|nr:adenosylcobinamide-GDP ribazoletransferase [Gloeobacter morelensis]UFP93721.1 adenosylcobinamide-GDP ribazoletransferase [Gloeobacter morelensis MG652769]
MRDWLAALLFYTALPLPLGSVSFDRIARWLPAVGLVVGGLNAGVYALLLALGFAAHLAALLAVVAGLWITGGLHLDGLIDTADGWAAGPERRLAAMADSAVGAFGVMAAIALLATKTFALAELAGAAAPPALVLAAVTARWGQLVAIGWFPYLKSEGKGKFLKDNTHWPADGWFGSVWWLASLIALGSAYPAVALAAGIGGALGALLSGALVARRFGGHTGDTYGAVIEVGEAMALVLATLV